jgi:hypothetical protein
MKLFAVLALAATLGAGCSQCADAVCAPAAPERTVHLYRDSGDATSRVERSVMQDGSERLHGETLIASLGLYVVEDVALDDGGRLVHATVRVGDATLVFAPARGSVSVDGAELSVPADAPWAYLVRDADGAVLATPIAGWVELRAARAAAVRVVDPGRGRSDLVVRDQLVFDSEVGVTVVLGDRALEVDGAFVTLAPLPRGGSLGRVGTIRIRPEQADDI